MHEGKATFISIADLKRHVGQEVAIRGWLYGKRSGGKIAFLLVRDGTGIVQCVVEARQSELFETATGLTQESSVSLAGRVRADERAPGGCEITLTRLDLIHAAQDYPVTRKSHGIDFLLNHRHLWLRTPRQATLLRIRHTIVQAIRRFFDDLGFTLIDTPILTPGAAEGAGTLFPVDYFGEEVYLAQTGQLYLESACAALGKVYCFGPTFRAEKSKTRRHLTEFWMVEPEIAFAQLDDLVAHAEALICQVVQTVLARHREDLRSLDRDVVPLEKIMPGFPRLTYSEAVELLRSPATQERLLQTMAQDKAHLGEWMRELDDVEKRAAAAGKEWQKEQLARQAQELRDRVKELDEDLQNRPLHIEQARTFEWGKDLGGAEETILSQHFEKPVVITEYPREAKAFYMKQSTRDPRVVLNLDILAPEGYGEIVGGSQREDDLDALLRRMGELKMDTAPYEWYLDLRRYGSVPHGGYGLGIERTVAWLCGLKHVREAIPFPRMMGRVYP